MVTVKESNHSRMRRLWLLLSFVASGPLAQGTLEVITLRHSTAEQVIPVLRPLLEPGGALSGQYNQLIVRTSAGNLAQIRTALDAIDRPQGRLTILVRFDSVQESGRRDVQAERIESTVRGRLGEWIELGGTSTAAARSGSGILSSRESSATGNRRIWVKVEEHR